jgi:hypothetical protein
MGEIRQGRGAFRRPDHLVRTANCDVAHRLPRSRRSVGPLPRIKPQFRVVDGVRIRYAESDGPPEHTILLTSPWPESIYAFAPMWATLAERARLFAIDLPGFGASERRDDLLSARTEPAPTNRRRP